MSSKQTKADALARLAAYREEWRQLVAEVGVERMERPGLMGAWTFKDLSAHLTFWRDWTIARLEAGLGIDTPAIWPPDLTAYDPGDPDATNWDPINAWVYAQHRDRPVREVLADADTSFVRLAAAIAALPDEDVATPGRFAWLGDEALADGDFAGHLRDEHEPAIRAWLAGQQG